MTLKERIESLFSQDPASADRDDALRSFNELKFFLNHGEVRAANKSNEEGNVEGWIVNSWVKKGILLGFRLGKIHDYSPNPQFQFFDKSTFPLKHLSPDDGVQDCSWRHVNPRWIVCRAERRHHAAGIH